MMIPNLLSHHHLQVPVQYSQCSFSFSFFLLNLGSNCVLKVNGLFTDWRMHDLLVIGDSDLCK